MPDAYVKQTWIDGVAGGTPISAARLTYIEDGIENATVEDGTFADNPTPGTARTAVVTDTAEQVVTSDRVNFVSAVPRRFPFADVYHESFDSPEVATENRDRVRFQKAADWLADQGGAGAMHVPRKGADPWTFTRNLSDPGSGAWCVNLKSGCKVFGDGRRSDIKLADNQPSNSRLFVVQTDAPTEVEICELSLDGNKANQPLANDQSHGIFTNVCSKIVIHHLWMRNIAGDGVFLFNDTERAEVTHLWLDDCNRQGINVQGANYVLVGWNNIKNCGGNAIKSEISAHADRSFQQIVHNIIFGGTSGISFVGEDATRVMRSIIGFNTIKNASGSGVQLARAGLIDVMWNHIYTPGVSGVSLLRDVYDSDVAFNTVEGALGVGSTDGGIGFGGLAGASSRDIRLRYNKLLDGAGVGMNLRANGSDGLNRVRSVGNLSRGNASFGAKISGVQDFKSVNDEFRLNGDHAVVAETLSTVVPKHLRFYHPTFEFANTAHSALRWTNNIDGLGIYYPEMQGTIVPTTPLRKEVGADVISYFDWVGAR